jgi:hypothetical protein
MNDNNADINLKHLVIVKLVREMIWYLANDGLTKYTDKQVISMIIETDNFSFDSPPSYTIFRSIICHIFSTCKEMSMQNALYPIPKEEEDNAIIHIIDYVINNT